MPRGKLEEFWKEFRETAIRRGVRAVPTGGRRIRPEQSKQERDLRHSKVPLGTQSDGVTRGHVAQDGALNSRRVSHPSFGGRAVWNENPERGNEGWACRRKIRKELKYRRIPLKLSHWGAAL